MACVLQRMNRPCIVLGRGIALRRSVLSVCFLLVLVPQAMCRASDQARGDHWAIADTFPADIDFVAVMDDPSEQLLSGAGQASRTMLGSMGMFNKTRRAWGALGRLFETDADGVVESLMSGRVVILVDGLFEDSINPLKFLYTADTNWVVMGEVDDSVFEKLRQNLKPVPREIVTGVPVYGIEAGRYWMVMLKGDEHGPARVMLSPKGGRALLERSMKSMLNQDQRKETPSASPRWDFDQGWGVAMRVRIDQWIEGLGRFGWEPSQGRDEHFRCVMGSADGGFELSFATNYHGDVPSGQAPVGLLGALDDDTVLAMAAASIFRFELNEQEGLSIMLDRTDDDRSDAQGFDQSLEGDTVLIPDGSLFVFSEVDLMTMDSQDTMGMTVLSAYEPRTLSALLIDSVMEPLVLGQATSSETGGEPSDRSTGYNGLFPGAVRTCDIQEDSEEPSRVSWLTTERSDGSELILSFSETGVDTGRRVRKLSEASASLDAISSMRSEQLTGETGMGVEASGVGGGSSVLLSGFLRVQTLLDSISEVQWMGNLELIDDFGLITWELLLDEGVMRGRVEFR